MFVLQLAPRVKSRTGDGEGEGSYGNWTNGGREDVDISQGWRGRGTPVIKMGKQRPREATTCPQSHSDVSHLQAGHFSRLEPSSPPQTWWVSAVSCLVRWTGSVSLGLGVHQGFPDPPPRATWNLPSFF